MATLSLSEALQQAKNNNPLYLQRLNNAATARWQVRNAYGQLLPSASVSGGMDYTGSGQANFGQGFTRQTSAIIGSSYNAGFSWQLDGSRLLAPKEQKANQRAVDEEIVSEESGLRFAVTEQYLTSLQAAAQVAVARQQVERNQNFLDLANAKYRVGQGTLIEVRQAEVQKAQSDVALLRSSAGRERGQARAVPPDRGRAAARGRADRAQRLVPGDRSRTYVLSDLLTSGRSAESVAAGARRPESCRLGRGHLGQDGVPAQPVGAGRMERLHPATDRRGPAGQPGARSAPQGSAAGCFTNDSIRVGAGLRPHRRARSRLLHRRGSGSDRHAPCNPRSARASIECEQQVPVRFHRAALRGQPDHFPADLHRLRPLAAGCSRRGNSLRTRRSRCGPRRCRSGPM